MSTYLNYMLEANLGLVVFLTLYWLLLRNETDFAFKRAFLLGSIGASIAFPLFNFSQHAKVIPSVSTIVPAYWLPEVVVGDGAVKAATPSLVSDLSIWQVVAILYLAGVAFFLLRFVLQLLAIWRFCHGARFSHLDGKYYIIQSPLHLPTFSFFNMIFLGNTDDLDEKDRDNIIRHEMVHVQQWHSVDVLVIEFLRIAFWFNPLVHILKNLITQLHEFQADQKVTATQDVQRYCSLLARVALQSAGLSLANHFNRSLTVKRITMMKTLKTKVSNFKIAMVVPIVAAFFFTVACQDQVLQEVSQSTLTQISEFPAVVQNDIDNKYKVQFPDARFSYMEGEENELREKLKAQATGQMLLNTYSFKERGVIGVLLKDINQTETINEVFVVVEESAQFPGGMTAFYEYVKNNFKYPEAAKSANAEGRVFVEFVVNTDGTTTDPKVLKGIGYGCDEEAVRIIQNSPNWIPGKQRGKAVRQRMVLPVVFSSQGEGGIETGKIEQRSYKMNVNNIQKQNVNGKVRISGLVVNEEGTPMAGMNVIVAGTTTGTVTDRDGTFSVTTENKSGKLVFSFIGFDSKEIAF